MKVLVLVVCMTASWALADFTQAAERGATTTQPAKLKARTGKDVQRVFEKHKGFMYAAYRRALRENPQLKGKILLSIAIAPDGRVIKCAVASSTLNNPEFEKTIVEKFSAIDFEAKGSEVYNDPGFRLEFLPAV